MMLSAIGSLCRADIFGRCQCRRAIEIDNLALLHEGDGLERSVITALLHHALEHFVNRQSRHEQ
jgi:hypothetical protein